MSLALGAMRGSGQAADVDALIRRIARMQARVHEDAEPHWEEGDMVLAGRRIHMPLLKFD